MKNIGHQTKGHRFDLILPQKGARGVVLNQVELGLRWTLRNEDNKKCSYCGTEGHTRNHCPNNSPLR